MTPEQIVTALRGVVDSRDSNKQLIRQMLHYIAYAKDVAFCISRFSEDNVADNPRSETDTIVGSACLSRERPNRLMYMCTFAEFNNGKTKEVSKIDTKSTITKHLSLTNPAWSILEGTR